MSDSARAGRQIQCAIRVDASPRIGAGHFRRCLTLATSLAARSVRTTFVCRGLPAPLAGLIHAAGHRLITLPPAGSIPGSDSPAHAQWLGADQAEDAQQTRAALEPINPDWLIVDHYGIDYRWERLLRPCAGRLMIIDDLADRSHECDLLLDQNYYQDAKTRYAGKLDPDCRQLLGPRYALLRAEFRQARERARGRSGNVERILVFFGGVDSGDRTGLALNALDNLGRTDISVDVVTGAMNPHNDRLAQRCATRPNTRFLTEVDNIWELMTRADLALGAGGSATWERCCLGLPTLALVTADNQRRLTNDLCEAGFVLCPSTESGAENRREFEALLAAMLSSRSLLHCLSSRSLDLVDGRGTERVCSVILSSGLSIRRATNADRERVYEWRNHPVVRANSRDPAPISAESHARWYTQTLQDPQRVLLIAEIADSPLAVVRFDIAGRSAETSIYLSPEHHGGGWGSEVLLRAEGWLHRNHPDIDELVAEILPGNLASRGAFLRAGYLEMKTVFVKHPAGT